MPAALFVQFDEDAMRTESDSCEIRTYEESYEQCAHAAAAPTQSTTTVSDTTEDDDIDDDIDDADDDTSKKTRLAAPTSSNPTGGELVVTPKTARACSDAQRAVITSLINRFGIFCAKQTFYPDYDLDTLLKLIRCADPKKAGETDGHGTVPYPPSKHNLLVHWLQPTNDVISQAAQSHCTPLADIALKQYPFLHAVRRQYNARMLFEPRPGEGWPLCIMRDACMARNLARTHRKAEFTLRAFYTEQELCAVDGNLSKLSTERYCLVCLRFYADSQKTEIENHNYPVPASLSLCPFYNLVNVPGEYLMSDCFGPTSARYAGVANYIVRHKEHFYTPTVESGCRGFLETGYGFPETHDELLYFCREA